MTRRQALYKLMSNQSNRAHPKILPYSLSKYNTAAHVGRLEHNLTFVHHVGVSNGNQHLPTASRLPSEQITHFYLSLSFFFPSFLNLSSYFSSSSPLIFFFHPSSLPSQLLSSISLPCHSPSLFVLCVHVWPSPLALLLPDFPRTEFTGLVITVLFIREYSSTVPSDLVNCYLYVSLHMHPIHCRILCFPLLYLYFSNQQKTFLSFFSFVLTLSLSM